MNHNENRSEQQPDSFSRDEIVFEWEAPVRPFRERSAEWFKTVAVIVILVSVVAIFLKEFLLLGVVFALAFVTYVLSSNPPQMVKHKIASEGVYFGGKLYVWKDLLDFYFKDLDGSRALFIRTRRKFPSVLILLLSSASEEMLARILGKHLKRSAPPEDDWMEKSARWLSSKVGLK